MKKLYTSFFLLLSIFLFSGCTEQVNTQENVDINFIGLNSRNFLIKKMDAIYLNKNLLYSGVVYETSWLDLDKNPLKSLDSQGNYLFIQDQDKKIGSKKLIYSGGFYEANFPRIEGGAYKNFYNFGNNIAYFKCEKLMFFGDTNTNDCLANQIRVNNKLIDQIDMDFFDKNRKYLFGIRYIDDNKMVYVKGEKYFIYDILKDKKEEYTELNKLRNLSINKAIELNYIRKEDNETTQFFDFIGYYNDQIVTTEENYGNMYDDILIEDIKTQMQKYGDNPENYEFYSEDYPLIMDLDGVKDVLEFPSYSDTDELFIYPYVDVKSLSKLSSQTVGDLYDIYIDGKLYETNALAPTIKDNNIFYIKHRNIFFEENNNNIFKLPQKNLIQHMLPKSASNIEYTLYKGKQMLSKFEKRSNGDSFYESIFKIFYSKENNCRMNITSDYTYTNDITICTDGLNTLIQTASPDSVNTGLRNELLLYNGVKVELAPYLYNTLQDIQKPNLLNNFDLLSQFIFGDEGLKGIVYVSPKMNSEKLEDLKMIESLRGSEKEEDGTEEKKMLKYISTKIGIPYSAYEALSGKDLKDYTSGDTLIQEKFDNYLDRLEKNNNINYLEFSKDSMSFQNPQVIIENVDELLGVY